MKFSLRAFDASRQVVSLTLDAASEAAAREHAQQQGLNVFFVKGSSLGVRRAGRFSVGLFSIELLALLDAGLNLVEALQTLAEKGSHGEVLPAIVAAINRGEPFSRAVAALPRHFPPLYVATIQASERTGNVKEALGRYIAYQEEFDRVRKKVVSACIYPAILAVVGSMVLGFLMFYVVPRFARVYEGMAGTLPFFSKLLLGFGNFVGHNAWPIATALLFFVSTVIYFVSKPEFRSSLNARLWRVPAIGERLKVLQLSRLYRTAGMLLRAGIPAVRALDMVKDLLATHLRSQLVLARQKIEQGQPMSAALTAAGLATPVATRMMQVGERSGDMGRMLGEIARFHDDEVARFVDFFTRAFEPLLMTVLGLSVGAVVVLMYMPIFELAGSIQ